MTIGLGPNATFIPAAPATENGGSGRHQRSVAEQTELLTAQTAGAGRVDPVTLQKRVEALQQAEFGRVKRQREQEELPRENQQALQLYRTNQLRPDGRGHGGELVGIDLFI